MKARQRISKVKKPSKSKKSITIDSTVKKRAVRRKKGGCCLR